MIKLNRHWLLYFAVAAAIDSSFVLSGALGLAWLWIDSGKVKPDSKSDAQW